VPRYLVERTFPAGLNVLLDTNGASAFGEIVARNATEHVVWVHSYVSPDKRKSFCIYDAPDPEAIWLVASRNSLPVGTIT
jgi:hypothetical protein